MKRLPLLRMELLQFFRQTLRGNRLLVSLLLWIRKLAIPCLLLSSSMLLTPSLEGSWQGSLQQQIILWIACLLVSLTVKLLLENERPALPAVVHIQPGQNRIIPYYLLLEVFRLCNLNLLLLMAPFQSNGWTGLSNSAFTVSALLLSLLGTYLVLVIKRSSSIGRFSLSYIRLYRRPDYGIRRSGLNLQSSRSGMNMYLLRQMLRTKVRTALPVMLFFPAYAIWMLHMDKYSSFEIHVFCLLPTILPALLLEMGFTPESVSADGLMLQPGQALRRILKHRTGISLGLSLSILLLISIFFPSTERWDLICQGLFLIGLVVHATLPNAAILAKRIDYKHDNNAMTFSLYSLVEFGSWFLGAAVIILLSRFAWGSLLLLGLGILLGALLPLNIRLCYEHFHRVRHARLAVFRTTLK